MKHWDFGVVCKQHFLNCNQIHPLKQRDVASIVECAKNDKNIKRLLIFGSATRFDCNSYSDIDLFVERDDNKLKSPVDYSKVLSDVDVIYGFKCGKTLKDEIEKTGVEVYRR